MARAQADKPLTPVGARIEARLRVLGKSQRWLEREADLNDGDVTKIKQGVSGDKRMGHARAQRIADVLGMSYQALFEGMPEVVDGRAPRAPALGELPPAFSPAFMQLCPPNLRHYLAVARPRPRPRDATWMLRIAKGERGDRSIASWQALHGAIASGGEQQDAEAPDHADTDAPPARDSSRHAIPRPRDTNSELPAVSEKRPSLPPAVAAKRMSAK